MFIASAIDNFEKKEEEKIEKQYEVYMKELQKTTRSIEKARLSLILFWFLFFFKKKTTEIKSLISIYKS